MLLVAILINEGSLGGVGELPEGIIKGFWLLLVLLLSRKSPEILEVLDADETL